MRRLLFVLVGALFVACSSGPVFTSPLQPGPDKTVSAGSEVSADVVPPFWQGNVFMPARAIYQYNGGLSWSFTSDEGATFTSCTSGGGKPPCKPVKLATGQAQWRGDPYVAAAPTQLNQVHTSFVQVLE